MSVKRFEEQVRDSMEELKFSPSENVWAGVVSELDKRRKRRVALWWIPIGLLLVGSVYFWNQSQVVDSNTIAVNEKTSSKEKNSSADKTSSTEKNSSTEIIISNEKNVEGRNSEGIGQQELISDADHKSNNSNETSNKKGIKNNSSDVNFNKSADQLSSNSTNNLSTKSFRKPGSVSSVKSTSSQNKTTVYAIGSSNKINEKSELAANVIDEEINPEASSIKFDPQSSLAFGEIKTTLPLKEYKTAAAAPAKSIIRNWSYGLNVAVGAAGIYDRNLIRQTDATARSYSAFLPSNLSNIVYRTAVVEPGAFYAIGGFVERPIGRSFNLSAGLNYTRYNSKVNVGAKISRSTTIFPGTTDNQDVPFYYSPDPKGSYQMHHSMLELPVTIRFNYKSVSANAGVTGSTLVSADMLAFDARTGVYYKEKDKLNRFQFGLTGGFDVSVLKKAKYPLHIGPVFRYQVSDITSRYSDSRHLISAALQARFYLQR
jgi:hypothetical protein